MLVLSRKDGASSRGSPRGRDDRGSSAAKGIAGIAGLLVALSLGLTSVPSPVADLSLTAASTPPRHTDSPIVDVQDLETSPAFLDDFSVYSYGKVATNGSGAAVLFWNAMSSGVFVAPPERLRSCRAEDGQSHLCSPCCCSSGRRAR